MSDRLLLDTHAFVWWVTASPELSAGAVGAIRGAAEVSVSLVSLWEIVLKEATRHPMVGTDHAGRWFADAMSATDFASLPIEARHVAAVQHLPGHHADPFDRLLIAQATDTGRAIVTRDRTIPKYDVLTVW